MYDYIFTREYGDAIHTNAIYGEAYNIGHDGEALSLSDRIISAFSGAKFVVKLSDTQCIVSMETQLSSQDEATLSDLVNQHKLEVDWPFTLEEYKAVRVAEIDARTVVLIQAGFSYNGSNFSMSDAAQRNWIGLNSANNSGMLTFPMTISTVDEGSYTIQDTTDFSGFIAAFLVYQSDPNQPLGQGRTLKAQINAATTIQEVEAVVDNR